MLILTYDQKFLDTPPFRKWSLSAGRECRQASAAHFEQRWKVEEPPGLTKGLVHITSPKSWCYHVPRPWCSKRSPSLLNSLPKIQRLPLIMRKHQTNPNRGMFHKIPDRYFQKCQGNKRQAVRDWRRLREHSDQMQRVAWIILGEKRQW